MSRHLTLLQKKFVEAYTAGPEGIRGNGTKAFFAAGGKAKTENVAANASWRLLRIPKVQAAIQAFHRQAEHEALVRLKDWKILSVESQEVIVRLQKGELPIYTLETEHGVIEKPDAAAARVMLDAAKFIVERGYPSSLRLSWHDPKTELAALIGVDPADLP